MHEITKHKKFFSKIATNYLILGVLALTFQLLLLNINGLLNVNLFENINIATILTAICNYLLPFPIFIFLMSRLDSERLPKQNINIKTFIQYISITFTLMWIGNIIGLALTTAIGLAIHNDVANPIQNLINSTDIWLNILLISIIGPIFEEIIFRKLLIDRTIKYGARVSIILSAVLFALFHGNLNQFFYALFMGGFFAYIYIKTGKIIYTIILHLIINLTGSVAGPYVVQSANAVTLATHSPTDLAIVLIYFIIIVTFLIIGLIGLSKYKKAKFNGSKTEINLKKPMTNIFLNIGMTLFTLFFAFQIIYQLII